jgi:hypothetical protein
LILQASAGRRAAAVTISWAAVLSPAYFVGILDDPLPKARPAARQPAHVVGAA